MANSLQAGQQVVLGQWFWHYGLEGATVTLKRQCMDGAWIAHVPGQPFDELHIGSGYDFTPIH